MGILTDKKILITGVLNDQSLAFGAARLAQTEGAEIILTGVGRGLSITSRTARKLPTEPEVLELDVTNPDHIDAVREHILKKWGRLDGVLHAIGFAPSACLEGDIFNAGWSDISVAIEVSAYSLKALVEGFLPLLRNAGTSSVVGLDFDATLAWPGYNWMGVAKAALESVSRYLARDAGKDKIRVNLISAGPIRTIAAKSVSGFSSFDTLWSERSPLGWSMTDSSAVAKAIVAFLSDWFPATTGEIVHVDGGYHAVGA